MRSLKLAPSPHSAGIIGMEQYFPRFFVVCGFFFFFFFFFFFPFVFAFSNGLRALTHFLQDVHFTKGA